MSILRPFLARVIRHGQLTVLSPDGSSESFGAPAAGYPEVTVRFTTRKGMRRIILDPRLGAGGSAPVLGRGTRPTALVRGPTIVDAVGMYPLDGSESRAWGDRKLVRFSWQQLT